MGEKRPLEELERKAKSGPSAAEAQLRVLGLKKDSVLANRSALPRRTAGLFKEASSTDLLFLIDTTGSMANYIEAAKTQIKSIVHDIKATFFDEASVRISVVGYKDHHDKPNIQFLDFTNDVDEVHRFLSLLGAIGGDDLPEDVLGGIQQALDATWEHQTRCIIHIGDSPPHGRTLHDGSFYDMFPVPGKEPHGLTHEPLLSRMIELNINYAFLRITKHTDRMAFAFFQAYAAISLDCKLHPSNKYFRQARNLSSASHTLRDGSMSKRGAVSTLRFEEAELGTTYSALKQLVVNSVTSSATRTASRVFQSSTLGLKVPPVQKLSSKVPTITEELETTPAQWNTPGWLDVTLTVEAYFTDVVMRGTRSLDDMMSHDDNIKICTTDLTIHKRSRSFAHGSMRVASYARTAASTNRLVVKSFKRDGKDLMHFADDMRCQALCKAFALEFNALVGKDHSIDFIVAACLKPKSGKAPADNCMALEPFIEGKYVKYNSNSGWVNEEHSDNQNHQAAQAFSHFTFERSKGRFLVSDLQGVGKVLTDPAIHTSDPERFKLADTNLGESGFKFFFSTHKCNNICRKLKLESKASMIVSGKYAFRKKWPVLGKASGMMVCCSNKLCSRIVRASKANSSRKYPGYYWCNECWPQLQKTKVKLACGTGPRHEFGVSLFFYESQGQIVPQRCPDHLPTEY